MVERKEHPSTSKQEPKRKKRRDAGTYACSSCPKVFNRSDHLARHYLNHQPKEVYVCDYVITSHKGLKRTCGKTFVRKDLRERHLRRHLSEKPDDENVERPEAESNLDRIKIKEEPHDTIYSSPAEPSSQQHPVPHGPDKTDAAGNNNFVLQGQHQTTPTGIAPPGYSYGNQMHTNQMHTNQMHTNQMHTNQMHTNQMPMNQMPMHQMPMHQMPMNQMPPSQVSANQIPAVHSTYQKPLLIQSNAQGQNSPLYQVYPQPYQMHFSSQQSQYPYSSSSVDLPYQHSQESSAHPSMQNAAQRFHPPPKSHSYDPTDFNPLDPNTVNPHDLMRNYMPQPSNDVLSWLFMESSEPGNDRPQIPNTSHTSASFSDLTSGSGIPSPLNPPYLSTRNTFSESNLEYGTAQSAVDPVLNVGLQDLNYFSNNDNPLEEAFNTSPVNHALKFVSAVSSSPTNTNESSTPQSVSEKSLNEPTKLSPTERLEHHFHRVNLKHNAHLYVDEVILDSWLEEFPEISRENIRGLFNANLKTEGPLDLANRLSYYLHAYWVVFHPKFSILHRPSFDTRTAQPLLVFAMMCVGAMYCVSSAENLMDRKSIPEFKFCMLIAEPLRFKLFQHPAFKTPISVWVLQTLNLLEWSEKNYLSRHMHERAHVHHGTTVQLLRRSPFLGGNPDDSQKHGTSSSADSGVSGSEEENSDAGVSIDVDANEAVDNDSSLFEKWVESESMKRITFMTFYLDITDYIKFRHNPQIPFFQLQFLNLPCDDDRLWDCDEVNGSFKKLLKKQKSLQKYTSFGGNSRSLEGVRAGMNFLSALKRLIKASRSNYSCRKLSVFTRAILFGGITSVMHQVQQAELQTSFTFLLSNSRSMKSAYWKDFIVKASDYCEVWDASNAKGPSEPSFPVQKGQCWFPMYHLLHIIGLSDVNHYDIAIFGGSSQNMSVKATPKDYNIVKRKLTTLWQKSNTQCSDMSNTRSVIHCYWVLWSLMLKPMEPNESAALFNAKYSWSVDGDYYDMMYPISVSMLVLWCYTFTVCGAESSKFEDAGLDVQSPDKMDMERVNGFVAEGGYEYLFRIREEFKEHVLNQGLTSDYLLHCKKGNGGQVPPHEAVAVYCGLLQKITCKQNISGLCLLVGTELLKSQWEIVRENAKLIINCGLRSLGKVSIHCPDLFKEAD